MREAGVRDEMSPQDRKKPLKTSQLLDFQWIENGDGGGARTHDPLSKSHLSYSKYKGLNRHPDADDFRTII